MPMNKQAGNMYSWVTHTWNPIRGKCPHDCSYCYMKRFKVGKLRLAEEELKTDLGEGNVIFVGSSTDMWAGEVPPKWTRDVMEHCKKYPNNTYLFQSKNPIRLDTHNPDFFPPKTIIGTTIETNRPTATFAPQTPDRYLWMEHITYSRRTMISIEPIMDFDLDVMVEWMKKIKPEFVSIGADSQNHNLPEPSPEKVDALITELKKFTEVKIKSNLKRIR